MIYFDLPRDTPRFTTVLRLDGRDVRAEIDYLGDGDRYSISLVDEATQTVLARSMKLVQDVNLLERIYVEPRPRGLLMMSATPGYRDLGRDGFRLLALDLSELDAPAASFVEDA